MVDNTFATVITGATSGIGLATAKLLVKKNHSLALIARDEKNLKSIRDLLDRNSNIKIYSCDISKSEQVKNAFKKISQDFRKIKYLVNCASITHSKTIENYSEREFIDEVRVNLDGTYFCIMAAYKNMLQGGAIVNFSSVRARTGAPTSSVGYAAAKAAIINLTKTFALQLAKYGIRVNCISPGAIYPTRFTEKWSKVKLDKFVAQTPLRRLGKPEDIANAVEFLLSEKASFITGHTLDVNGGVWM